MKIKVELDLYHGCEKLVETQVVEEVYFSNNVVFDKWTNFGDLRYCQLPVKTRLSANVILVFQFSVGIQRDTHAETHSTI